MEKRTKESKKRLNSLILLIAFTAIMLIASTYAWFTTQKNVSINNLKGVVEVAEGLEISLDAENWGSSIDLDTLSIITNGYDQNHNIDPSELLPVSTVGEFNDSEKGLAMIRGELDGVKFTNMALCDESKYGGEEDTTAWSKFGTPSESTDPDVAIKNLDYPSFIAFDVFLRNTSRGAGTSKDTLQLNKGSKLGVIDSSGEYGQLDIATNVFTRNLTKRTYNISDKYGLQNCARVGFALYENKPAEGTKLAAQADKTQILAHYTDAKKLTDVSIWEPNANTHIDYILKNNNKVATHADNGGITKGALKADSTFRTAGIYKAAAGTYTAPTGKDGKYSVASSKTIDDIYNWADLENTAGDIADGGSDDNKYMGIPDTIIPDYNTDGTKAACDLRTANKASGKIELEQNSVSKMRIYVWLEGQDVDCINWASFGGGIEVDINLCKGETAGAELALSAGTP